MNDLDVALAQIAARQAAYQLYQDYYDGKHRLAFASEKMRNAFSARFKEFADNLCPAVIDAVVDRLVVTGFQTVGAPSDPDPRVPQLPDPAGPATAPEPPTLQADLAEDADAAPPDPADLAWDLWQAAHLDRVGGELYQEAATTGDAYLIVWPDAAGVPQFDPQPAAQCTVAYDPDQRRRVLWGAKVWQQPDGTVRANLYYPARIEKYVTAKSTQGTIPADSKTFVPYAAPGEAWPLPNPYGTVPIFHFATNARLGRFGRSDLLDVLPLQDALNKAVCDMLVGMEFTAFPQRWVTGMQVELDEQNGRPIQPLRPGEDQVWWFEDPNVKLGQFDPASLENYLKVQDSLRAEIARVSGTPVHYLMLLSGHWPSGEALRIAEVRLTHKILDRELAYGETWAAAFTLALRILKVAGTVTPEWQDPAPKSQLELAQELQLLQGVGVPDEVLQKLWGFTDSEIAGMAQLKARKVAAMQAIMGPPQAPPGTPPAIATNGAGTPPAPATSGAAPAQKGAP